MAQKVILIVFIGVLIACSNAMKETNLSASGQPEALAKIMAEIAFLIKSYEGKPINNNGHDGIYDQLNAAIFGFSQYLEEHDINGQISDAIYQKVEADDEFIEIREFDPDEFYGHSPDTKQKIINGCIKYLKLVKEIVLKYQSVAEKSDELVAGKSNEVVTEKNEGKENNNGKPVEKKSGDGLSKTKWKHWCGWIFLVAVILGGSGYAIYCFIFNNGEEDGEENAFYEDEDDAEKYKEVPNRQTVP